MGAGASVIPPVNTGDEVVGVEGSPKIVGLKELPDAIGECKQASVPTKDHHCGLTLANKIPSDRQRNASTRKINGRL